MSEQNNIQNEQIEDRNEQQEVDPVAALMQKMDQISSKLNSLEKQQTITKNAYHVKSNPFAPKPEEKPKPELTFQEKDALIRDQMEKEEQELLFKTSIGDPGAQLAYDDKHKYMFEEIAFKNICESMGPEFLKIVGEPYQMIKERRYGDLLVYETQRFQKGNSMMQQLDGKPIETRFVPDHIKKFRVLTFNGMKPGVKN